LTPSRIVKLDYDAVLNRVKLEQMAKKRQLPKEVLKYFQAEGRKGGLLGGKARADALTPEKRKEIARKAAAARWGKKNAL
jgi:hypothetical protein